VTHGGDAPNIIPEYAAARFFIRAQNTEILKITREKVERCAQGAALATGAKLEIKIVNHLYESMVTSQILAQVLATNLARVGLKVEGKKRGKGSSDFGNVTRVVPACELSVRLGDGIVPHTREFLQAADSDAGYRVMIQGAKVMAMSVLDLLLAPELLNKAKEEFSRGRS
jgi:metal-dependent amidase/aminoacylase/carboxypeptidase family protein